MTTKFSQRHHEAIAQVIRDYTPHSATTNGIDREITTLQIIINDLDQMFTDDNPKYNGDRFRTKCGWHPVK